MIEEFPKYKGTPCECGNDEFFTIMVQSETLPSSNSSPLVNLEVICTSCNKKVVHEDKQIVNIDRPNPEDGNLKGSRFEDGQVSAERVWWLLFGKDVPRKMPVSCPFHEDQNLSAKLVGVAPHMLYCDICRRGWGVLEVIAQVKKVDEEGARLWLEEHFSKKEQNK